jgi:formylglycine-generating enzyme required for sulfatase activity
MRLRRLRTTALILAALAAVLWSRPAAAAGVPLSRKGAAAAVIVHRGVEAPAAALQSYVEKMSGARLPLAETPAEAAADLAQIHLRVVERLEGASEGRTADHAYRLRTADGDLHLTAQTALGLEYAVYGLLQDHLGVGFYSDVYEHIPQRRTLTVPELDTLEEPAFYHRNPMHFAWSHATGEATKEYARKNRQFPPSGSPHNAGHTFRKYKIHEHCPLDEAFQRELGEMFKERFAEQDPGGKPLGVGQMDGPYRLGCDVCPECKALIEKEGSYAAPMLVMLNAALAHAAEEYPEHEVMTFAYWNTLPVPKTIRPHENLWIQIVSSDASLNQAGDHLGEIAGNPANRLYEHAVREWPKVHDKVTTWHWATGGGYEWPNLFSHCENIRLWHRSGIDGAQEQTASGVRNSNWSELKFWVWHQLKWNPERDEEKLIDRFLRDYYGPQAAPFIRQYLETSDRLRRESGLYVPGGLVRWSAWSVNLRRKFLNLQATEELAALLDKAHEAAAREENPVYKQHLDEASARSLDPVMIDAVREAEGFARVEDPQDGSPWYVPGGRADMPERIRRATPRDRRREDWFKRRAGGRLYEIAAGDLRADVVPNYRGRIVALIHKPTGENLLVGDGYSDVLKARNHIQDMIEATQDQLRTRARYGGGFYGWGRPSTMDRTVAATADGDGLVITRRFSGKKPGPTRASAQWELRMPNPAATRVYIKGAGLDETVSGAGLLYRTEAIVHSVADAPTDAPITITIDRGDGLVIELAITAGGWQNVKLLPNLVSSGEQFDMDYHLIDSQITPEGDMQISSAGRFDWRRRPNWPGDYEVWPRERAAMVRIYLEGEDKPAKDAPLPEQRLTVRADGEKREVAAKAALDREEKDSQAIRQPQDLEITDDGRAINPLDGSELVWVPAGAFRRGRDEGYRDEAPARPITLDGFWISRTPITVAQYRRFLEATGREDRIKVPGWPHKVAPPVQEEGEYPVCPNWYDAQAYCAWAGGGLPTEAQWEKAARGTDGRLYPWGNEWDVEKVARRPWEQYVMARGLHPVGSAPAGESPYGALDMAGNAWEWVADWYDPHYYERAPAENPTGPGSGTFKVLRGGNVLWDRRHCTTTYRFPHPPWVDNWVQTGFRLVIAADAEGRPR